MQWEKVWEAYNINPIQIDKITDRVYKITTNTTIYGLKISKLTIDHIGHWHAVYNYICTHQIYGFVPLILTKDKEPYYILNQTVLFVHPWVESNRTEHIIDESASFFHAIGKLHGSTTQYVDNNENTFNYQSFDRKQKKEELLEYIKFFEAKRFMSPFELQACMHYRDIEWIIEQFEKWNDVYKGLSQETSQRKIVLCHNNLNPSHYVMLDDHLYFFNWEYARIATPIHDICFYLKHAFRYHDCDMKKIVEGLTIYQQYIQLDDREKCELQLQLLNIDSYIYLLENYVHQSMRLEIQMSKGLEQAFRQLLFANQLQTYMFPRLQVNQEED
ncbi:hypothetical protein ACFOZ1_11065 [Gracilibacillus marinus]|uniref:Spore coat protein YsxE n=1 Tax=Gracilibacillus marinus TaxID=630535 RepID=A0ABV8VXL0_9BACI